MMDQHGLSFGEHFATGCLKTRNTMAPTGLLRLQLLAIVCACVPLGTLWSVDVHEVLGGEGGTTEAAGKSHRPVILSPGVGVVGALINAQLGSVLWAIVDEDLLVLQDVL